MTQRSALVTGATDLLGKSISTELANAGFCVVVHDEPSQKESANSLCKTIAAQGGQAVPVVFRLGDEPQLGAMVEKAQAAFGPLSLLINTHSPVRLAECFANQAPDGVDNLIINIADYRAAASPAERFGDHLPNNVLTAQTVALAQQLGPRGIRVNAINPGALLDDAPIPEAIIQTMHYLIRAHAVTGQMIAVDDGSVPARHPPI